MKALFRAFLNFIDQIRRDDMLWAVCLAPLLAGCFFRLAIPPLNRYLSDLLGQADVFSPYYRLLDLLLLLLTPYMFCFAAAMVMLTEADENIAPYLAVTPVGKRGYLLSRLGIPAFISFFIAPLVLLIFRLTDWPAAVLFLLSLLACLVSITVAMLVFTLAHNRVEGMALAKLSGLVMLGLPVPFLLTGNTQYLFSWLPSFWMARLAVDHRLLSAVPAVLLSLTWIALLDRRFQRKLM